jgi:hypothetical protein
MSLWEQDIQWLERMQKAGLVKKPRFLELNLQFHSTWENELNSTFKYRGSDKSLAGIDNSYMKIKHKSCLSTL